MNTKNWNEEEMGLAMTCQCGGHMWRFTIDAINNQAPKGEHQAYDQYRCQKCKHIVNVFKTK